MCYIRYSNPIIYWDDEKLKRQIEYSIKANKDVLNKEGFFPFINDLNTQVTRDLLNLSGSSSQDMAARLCKTVSTISKMFLTSNNASLDDTTHVPNRFFMASDVQRVELGENIETCGEFAFAGCNHLEFVDLKKTRITTFWSSTFTGCDNLHAILLPEILWEIDLSSQFFTWKPRDTVMDVFVSPNTTIFYGTKYINPFAPDVTLPFVIHTY